MSLENNPQMLITTLTAAVTAVLGALIAFGFPLTQGQQAAIIGCIAAIVPVIFLLGPILHHFTYTKKEAADVQQKAAEATKANLPLPPLPK